MRAFERLIKYAAFSTVSDESCAHCPSTVSQLHFGRELVAEMLAMGIKDALIDENGYVYGSIPSNIERHVPAIGFIAHMDVSADAPCENIKCNVIPAYDGGKLVLNTQKGIEMTPEEFETLKKYTGRGLVTTDGTTLLGADDKAGIAEIMTMAELLQSDAGIPHGEIKIAFTPDEEIGRGADRFDVAGFGADFAYTVDGGAFGEVEYETFNAAAAKISVTGKSIHPGEAKNKMKNAPRIAMEFNSMLPVSEKPEYTEGREGFYHLTDMCGSVESAELKYILRDHDAKKLEEKKRTVERIAAFLNERYGEGTITSEITDSYGNMAEKIIPHMHLIDSAYEAVRQAGGEPFSPPVRGGTDGSKLSYMSLPCPNLGTGSHNHHGRFEYAVIEDMDSCVDTLINIAKIYAGKVSGAL